MTDDTPIAVATDARGGTGATVELTPSAPEPDAPMVEATPDETDDEQLSRSSTIRDVIVLAQSGQPVAAVAHQARAADASTTTDPADLSSSSGSAVVGSNRRLWEEEERSDTADDASSATDTVPATDSATDSASATTPPSDAVAATDTSSTE